MFGQDFMCILTTGLDRLTSETSVTNRPLHTFYSNNQAFVGPPLWVMTPSMNCHSHYVGKNEQQDSKHFHGFIGRCQKQCVTNIYTKSYLFHLLLFPVNLLTIFLFTVTDASCGRCWQMLEHSASPCRWYKYDASVFLFFHTSVCDPEVGLRESCCGVCVLCV